MYDYTCTHDGIAQYRANVVPPAQPAASQRGPAAVGCDIVPCCCRANEVGDETVQSEAADVDTLQLRACLRVRLQPTAEM